MKHTKKITILHSNDLHGDFLAEQVDEKLVGGVSMLSGYIEKVRAEEPNTIYAIAGDMFRGSVIDSEYKGLSTIEIMNALAPDIVTIGNHEVDYGIAHLLFIEKCARFPIINANLYIKNTSTRLFTPYKILRVDGMNILFIGIITQDVINQTKSESLVGSFVDTAAAAAEVGKICNAHNSIDIDFTVLLTHIGFEEDRHLARQLDPAWGVDLIIGGHSHTLPEHAVEENGVVIAQAGTGTDQIGRFDIIVDTDNNCIDSYTWRTVPICRRDLPPQPRHGAGAASLHQSGGRKVQPHRRALPPGADPPGAHPGDRAWQPVCGHLHPQPWGRCDAASAPAASGPKSWAPSSPTATSSRASPTMMACSCSR